MMTRRGFLLTLASAVGATLLAPSPRERGLLAAGEGARAVGDEEAGDALRSRAERKGLLYGAAFMKRHLEDAGLAAAAERECGVIVTENALQWSIVRPGPGDYDFEQADWLEQFARERGLLFRGHPLVFHEALPPWFSRFVTRGNGERLLREHITTVVGRYAGRTHSWDVVNEAVQPWHGLAGGLRKTPWLSVVGPRYIEVAFRTAAAADPKALLVLNQDQLEYDRPEDEACRRATLKLLEGLKVSGTPVHALGIQAHLVGDETRFSAAKLKTFLRDVAALGLKIMITEMDVADRNLPYSRSARDRIVAKRYEEFLSAVLEERAVIALITWGLSDKYTWLTTNPRGDGAPLRPLPLDDRFRRKLAWKAMAETIDAASRR